MATTGELKAIVQELELVDIGDAASYLGEECVGDLDQALGLPASLLRLHQSEHPATCTCFSCMLMRM